MSSLSRQLKALQFAEQQSTGGKRVASFLYPQHEAAGLDNATVRMLSCSPLCTWATSFLRDMSPVTSPQPQPFVVSADSCT